MIKLKDTNRFDWWKKQCEKKSKNKKKIKDWTDCSFDGKSAIEILDKKK